MPKTKFIIGVVIAFIVIIILAEFSSHLTQPVGSASSDTMSSMDSITSLAASSANLASSLLAGSPPTLGSANASVAIIEFGDYQCPTCGAWYRSQEKLLIQNLVNTGKAKLVWRDFDYYGPDSISASEAAYAAGDQGKFWQFHDLLFQNQQTPNGGWADRQNMQSFARQLGLNMTLFNQDFNSGNYDALINSNHNLGVQAGVSETPTFYLIGPNGKTITIAGNQPESVFEQAIASLTGG